MWDFLTKKCGIFGIEWGTKLWDFQHRGGDFCPLTSGHTGDNINKQQTVETGLLQIDPAHRWNFSQMFFEKIRTRK